MVVARGHQFVRGKGGGGGGGQGWDVIVMEGDKKEYSWAGTMVDNTTYQNKTNRDRV